MGGQFAAKAQHGAVAADHYGQITFAPDLGDVQCRIALHARIGAGFFLDHDLATLGMQKMGQFVQNLARGQLHAACHGRLMFADQGNVPEFALHGYCF